MIEDVKRHGLMTLLTTAAALVPLFGVLWFLLKPAMIAVVSEAVAGEFDQKVQQGTAPIQNAFKTLLRSDIAKLKREIAALRYQERHEPDTWTADDAEYLSELLIELEDLQEAYDDL